VSSAPADLEIARFAVGEVVGGTQTGRDAGTLQLSLPELAVGAGEPALAEATVDIVRPGEPIRIANVIDAVVPAVKADDPGATFPGALGPLAPAGRGRTHVLDGVRVIVSCDWSVTGNAEASEFPPSFVDMAGPSAERAPYASTTNVVVTCRPSPDATLVEADRAVRRAGLKVARELAAATIGAEPDDVERLNVGPSSAPDVPAVCAVLQVASEGPLVDTFLYGAPLGGLVPTLLDPLEVLDGALLNGTYDWPSVRNATASYQEGRLIRELLAADGNRLRFAGLILALGYLDTADDKQRSALQSARLARLIGADAAICTTFSSGNSHTDTMLTISALERTGIRTCAILAETNGGLTDHVPEADCIVSTGNEDELLEPWTPERVIGASDDAMSGERVPLSSYLGANDETGAFDLTAVSE
jgi:glycine reductase complex component B subunit alpha and beta